MLAPASDHAIWRTSQTIELLLPYERLLGETMRPVMAELTMINAGIIVACICNRHDEVLAEFVETSSELAMKPGTLRYDGHADIAFDWGVWPRITLGLGFRRQDVEAHFRAVFGRHSVGIELTGLVFAEALGDSAENLRRFAGALGDSRRIAGH